VLAAFRLHAAAHALYTWGLCWTQRHIPRAERIRIKKQQLRKATTLQQWQTIALQLDKSDTDRETVEMDGDSRLVRSPPIANLACLLFPLCVGCAVTWRGRPAP